MNVIIEKFGYPDSLVQEFEHWLVLVRPAQVTLGSLVLAAKSDATAFSQLSREAFTEQARVIAAVEKGLAAFSHYERINYLMLMMVDPHVHFHVIPRYSSSREWQGRQFPDNAWPGPPDLKSAIQLTPKEADLLTIEVKRYF